MDLNREMASTVTISEETTLNDLKVYALVPAAGKGERMGQGTPKQYIKVCGIPLVMHCLKALSEPSWIQKVIAVVDDPEEFEDLLREQTLPKVASVKGDVRSRHRSILEGLKAMKDNPPDMVVIHDGARPIVPKAILSQVILKARAVGAAGVVRPLVSTVVRPDCSNRLEDSLPRSMYRNSEMPQAFDYPMILEAYNKCSEEELDTGTECLAIAQHYGGISAYLVEGTSDLWKVTFSRDIEIARILLPKHCKRINIMCLECPNFSLGESLASTFSELPKTNLDSAPFIISLECFIAIFESQKFSNNSVTLDKTDKIMLCKNSIDILSQTSKEIIQHSVHANIMTSTEYLQKDCNFILSLCCIKSVLDAERILNNIKNCTNFFLKHRTILAIFNTVGNPTPEAEFLPLRQTIQDLFSSNNVSVMVIICHRDCNLKVNTQSIAKCNYLTQNQLGIIIEQSLKSELLQSLHGQVLFL